MRTWVPLKNRNSLVSTEHAKLGRHFASRQTQPNDSGCGGGEKIRDDWRPVAHGQRKTKVDMFGREDRDEERRLQEERPTELRERRNAEAADDSSAK